MTIGMWQSFLGWSLIINLTMIIVWAFVVKRYPDFVYKKGNYWIPIKRESFNLIHYGGLGLYELFIYFFLLVPYLVLLIIN